MKASSILYNGGQRRFKFLLFSTAMLMFPVNSWAACGLDGAVSEQLQQNEVLARKTSVAFGTCSVCHLASSGGPRNEYGNAINTLLKLSDGARMDPVRQRDAGQMVNEILANPLIDDSPTFGELFQSGQFPAGALDRPPPQFQQVPKVNAEYTAETGITVQKARELIQKVEGESRFGILQLSRINEISPAVAEVLADFRGEMLILGIKSASPEVAAALSKSQAANLWLHSLTTVAGEAAEMFAKLPGHLFLTSLTELDSVLLAEKLAARPGALSFPYLTKISPEVAAALAKNEQSLTLAGITETSEQVQEELALTVGSLSLPNLTQLDSLLLAKKLAANIVLLPKIQKLSAAQAMLMLKARFQGSFFGGLYLPLSAVSPEVAEVFAASPRAINLTLLGKGPLSETLLRTLLSSRLRLTLQDFEELTEAQIRVISDILPDSTVRSGELAFASIKVPNLKKLDSAQVAETLAKVNGFIFPAVKEISPEAAAALGAFPDAEAIGPQMKRIAVPSGALAFPALEELSPETARLLMNKRWGSISLPALNDVSLETVQLLAVQTSQLSLGMTALTAELAAGFAKIPMNQPMAGDCISFPYLRDLSPEAARVLVSSLNRGVREMRAGRFSNSPKLSLGGVTGLPTLSPELAIELAKYDGKLSIQGLGELPPESAAALASYQGPHLSISGPALGKFSVESSDWLAKATATLDVPVRHLDSTQLAERFVTQIGNSSLYKLETVSRNAAVMLTQEKSFLDLRALTVLDSTELATRFVKGVTTGSTITLPALSTLSLDAAKVLAAGNKPLYLGLIVLDSAEVASALSQSQQKVQLPRLQAATPEVIAILKEAKSVETRPLDTLYVLRPPQVRAE